MKRILSEFDQYLVSQSLKFDAVIIGGAVLNVLDISSRKTKDVDCLDPDIPALIKTASINFATIRVDLALDMDWLNNGPASLKIDLPSGWRIRLQPLYKGEALNLQALGRDDLLKSKLFAYCDRTTPDFEDLINLKPTKSELASAIDWVKMRDTNTAWPAHVEKAFTILKVALGYE